MDKYIEYIVRAIFITDNRVMIVTELLFTRTQLKCESFIRHVTCFCHEIQAHNLY